jgi:hypothetical protein
MAHKLARRTFVAGAVGLPLAAAAAELSAERAPGENEVPLPKMPYPRSRLIKGIRWLTGLGTRGPNGDVWTCTWADDDSLYSVADDTAGWNLSIYKVEEAPPEHLVTRVNEMKQYGRAGASGWWKGAGLTCIDDALYLGIYSQSDPRKGSATKVSFSADHSSIVKSVDHGKTWTPTASKEKPMFSGKEFPTPFFVQDGKDYSDAMDEFVYVVSNNGGWNNWDRMMLARVPRSKMPALDRADWEFFAGAEKADSPTWSPAVKKAAPIFEHMGYTGMTGIQYIPAVKRFVLAQWSYVSMRGGGDRTGATNSPPPWPDEPRYRLVDQTMFCLYEASKPWGPWRLFHAETPWGPAFYNPNFPAKWFTDGGRKMWLVEGGNYRGGGGYNFNVRQLELLF